MPAMAGAGTWLKIKNPASAAMQRVWEERLPRFEAAISKKWASERGTLDYGSRGPGPS